MPRPALGRLALVGLAALVAALVVGSYSVAVVVDDGNGNTGDETNSLTLAWTAYATGVPSYGVLSDGTPWTLGDLTLPIYYGLYGARLAHVDPEDRIGAAREISRVLVWLSLALALVALGWAAAFPQSRDRYRLASLVLAAASVCFAFAANQAFVFVGSYGRVDALGLLAVCGSAAALVAFRWKPGFATLLVYALTPVFAYFSNNVAFVLVAAIFALAVAAQLRRERLATFAGALGAAAIAGLVAHVLLNRVWLTPGVSTSTLYPDTGTVVEDVLNRMLTRSPADVVERAWDRYPELVGAIAVTTTAAAACLAWARSVRARAGSLPFSQRDMALLGLIAPILVGWLGVTSIPGARIGYAPMLLVASVLPYLLVVCAARGRRILLVGPALLLAALILLSPSIWTGRSVWGDEPVTVAATPRWQDLDAAQRAAAVVNAVREEHLQSLDRFLARGTVSPVLTDDPLFMLRNRAKARYFFLYEQPPTPAEEWRILRRARSELGARSLVTNVFGRDSFLHQYGYPLLKTALSAHPERATVEVRYPEGVVVARRLFVSRSGTGERAGVAYTYHRGVPATPFVLYSLELRPF